MKASGWLGVSRHCVSHLHDTANPDALPGWTNRFVVRRFREIWRRFLETYGNLCISPGPEFLRTLAWMRGIQAILKPRQTSNV